MNDAVKNALFAVGGLIVGGGVGYLISLQHMKKQVDEIMHMVDEEFEKMDDHYAQKYKEGKYSTPESARAAMQEMSDGDLAEMSDRNRSILLTHGYSENKDAEALSETDADTSSEGEPEQEVLSIFELGEEEGTVGPELDPVTGEPLESDEREAPSFETPADQEEEEDRFFADRDIEKDLGRPYLITVDEFMSDDSFAKLELIYFAKDGTLMDEKEDVIDDTTPVVGDEFVKNFGNHSDLKDVVYVRNPEYATDYEIHRDKRAFEEVILGVLPPRESKRLPRMQNEE